MQKKPYIVSDINLAAALCSIGIPLFEHEDGSPPFVKMATKHGQSYTFFFEHENDLGDMTDYYVKAWFDDQWQPEDSNHPFLYVKAFHQNKNALLDVVKQSASLVVIEKGNRFCLISSDMPEDIKAKLLSKL